MRTSLPPPLVYLCKTQRPDPSSPTFLSLPQFQRLDHQPWTALPWVSYLPCSALSQDGGVHWEGGRAALSSPPARQHDIKRPTDPFPSSTATVSSPLPPRPTPRTPSRASTSPRSQAARSTSSSPSPPPRRPLDVRPVSPRLLPPPLSRERPPSREPSRPRSPVPRFVSL